MTYKPNRKLTEPASIIYGKVPPQSPDLENAVIGSCLSLNGREVFEQVLGIITDSEVFYVDANQKIFSALNRLYNDSKPIDMLMVAEELRKANELEIVGGNYALMQLAKNVVSDANVEFHCRSIVEKYLGRELIRISGQGLNQAYDAETDVFELIEAQSDSMYQLLSGNIQSEPKNMGQVTMELSNKLLQQQQADSDVTGVPTGFIELDRITSGFQKQTLTILAARPSVGKTAFMLSLTDTAADNMYPVLVFSLEMSANELVKRMAAARSGVEMSQLNNPKQMTQDEWRRFNEAKEYISQLPIYIDDSSDLGINECRAKARKMKLKYGIEEVYIDYLQLMSGTGKDGNREQEISKISRGLKNMSKDLDIPVIALSQLNRSMENTSGDSMRDPRLSDLRESGAIEQDADNVIFIYNPSPKMISENNFFMGKKIINIAKGRNIGLGIIALEFNGSTQKWSDPPPKAEFKPYAPPENASAGISGRSYKDITEGQSANNYNPDFWKNES